MTTPTVFISYSHHDKVSAFAIDQWLRNLGARVLIDDRDFVPGADIEDEIVRCIRQSGKVISIYSRNSAHRPYVKLERRIASVLEADNKDSSKRLIYFCLDNTPLPQEARPRLAVMAENLSFKEACTKLEKAVLEVSSKPLEVDLTIYETMPPWAAPEESQKFRRSAEEVEKLFSDVEKGIGEPNGRITRIQWISEGPVHLAKQKLESIAVNTEKYAKVEIIAANIALDDLKQKKTVNDLLQRVEDKIPKHSTDDVPEESKVGIAAVDALTKLCFLYRRGEDAYEKSFKALCDALNRG